ncbi:WG repeat-containing protein, partial [Winogradskyella rapida]
KTITGLYGLIDNKGKTIVPAIYTRIEKFGEYANDIALVKTITGKYGFVNRNGKEIIEPKYDLKEIKEKFNQIYGG